MRIIIIGAGGHGKVVLDALQKSGNKILGFLDDDTSRIGAMIYGVQVLGVLSDMTKLAQQLPLGAFVAIGDNFLRKNVFLKLKDLGFDLVKAIHPESYVFDKEHIGAGTLIMPKAVVNIDAKVGKNCVINTSAVIEHDCVIGDHAHIAPNACLAGRASVGESAFIGAGAVILPKVKVGDGAVVGAGAIVLKDVLEFTVVAGNPAREIKKAERG